MINVDLTGKELLAVIGYLTGLLIEKQGEHASTQDLKLLSNRIDELEAKL